MPVLPDDPPFAVQPPPAGPRSSPGILLMACRAESFTRGLLVSLTCRKNSGRAEVKSTNGGKLKSY